MTTVVVASLKQRSNVFMYRRSLIRSAAAAGMLVRFLRIHIPRLAKRLIVIDPYSLADVVAMMTGAMAPSA